LSLDIHHDEDSHRFYAEVEGGEAELRYERIDPRTLDLTSTLVPPAARGAGIAGQVVRHAFDWARQHDVKLVATCPYVRSWLERHPQYRALEARPT
jgi:predicted GNAT family acetyltransferase